MPARLDLTPEQALERIERRREQTRLAVQRYRARQKAGVSPTVSPTPPDVMLTTAVLHARTNGHVGARSPELEVTSFPSEKRESTTTSTSGGGDDLAEVAAVLAPFAVRGKVPTRRYLERLRRDCPAVDLVAAALEAADWLDRPENHDRECNSGFLGGWVRRTDTRRKADAPPAPRHPLLEHGARSAVGRVVEYALEHADDAAEVPSTWR
jgi:hypothetical protein